MKVPLIDLRKLTVRVVLNTSSGSCDEECASKLESILAGAGIRPNQIKLVDGAGIEAALDNAVRSKADVLIVLGGDGTIRAAAERCGASGIKLIPLPGGTMNMLPRALYGEGTWDRILTRILQSPQLADVGGGEVDGHHFYCAGIFGSPALWADAREAARDKRWLAALKAVSRAYHHAFSRKVQYSIDGEGEGQATAISVICPLISEAVPSDAPAFEVAALDPDNIKDAAHLAWTAVFSSWRRDENVAALTGTKVLIRAHGTIPAILDGEKLLLARHAIVRFERNSFVAIIPKAPLCDEGASRPAPIHPDRSGWT